MTARIRAVDIRTGGPADLPGVARLMQAAFDPRYGEAWTTAQCMGMLALPGSWLTLVERDGATIGFALSRATLDDGELLLIAVHPDARGAGVGRALLRAVIEDAKARGVIRFNLEVRANNPATAFYVAEGFVKIGERRDYYRGSSGEVFDALTFQKNSADELSNFHPALASPIHSVDSHRRGRIIVRTSIGQKDGNG